MQNRRKTLLRDHSVPEVTLKDCPRHYSVSAIPETLTIHGPNRPPINGGESDLRGICSTGRQQVFQFQSIWLKTGVKSWKYLCVSSRRSISKQILNRGYHSIKLQRKVRRIFSHLGSVHRCWTIYLLNSNHRNRSPWPPI